MTDVAGNCQRVLGRIHEAAARSGRDPASIKLIAVTKTVPTETVREAVVCGIRHIGESRVQEALPRVDSLAAPGLTWHFIGHLQTNKAKKVAEKFDWVQSVDRQDLAEKLNQSASKQLQVLIEVKLHEEPNKSGVTESQLPIFVEQFKRFDKLRLQGLMAIPPYFDSAEDVRPYFRRLRDLANRFGLQELSMGMSHDFEAAIEEGATMVRVGTALFGQR